MSSIKRKIVKSKREPGGFAALPFCVLRSENFSSLTPYAVKLLMDFVAQYNGRNNGDLGMAWSVMEKRGWRSRSTLWNAQKELLQKGWIEISRKGGRHKATLIALTFYSIDECKGKLDIDSTHKPTGLWKINVANTHSEH